MKKQIVLSAALFVVAGFLTLLAHAQAPSIKVNVPFSFNAADKVYPAGEYSFSAAKENVVLLEKDGRTRLGLFLVNHVAGSDNVAQVKFQCYDSLCFLSQVWIPGIDGGFQTLRSRSETEVASKTMGKYVALLGTSPQK